MYEKFDLVKSTSSKFVNKLNVTENDLEKQFSKTRTLIETKITDFSMKINKIYVNV